MRKSILNPLLRVLAVLRAGVDTRLATGLYVVIPSIFVRPRRLAKSTLSRA
jgi:hypothetical protein